jgi:hypothetical protein
MLAGEEVERLGDDHLAFRVVVLEVAADGPEPVHVGQAADGAVARAVEGSADGLLHRALDPLLDLLDDRLNNEPRRLLGPIGDHVLERQQGADHLDVGRDLAERFGLKEELFQALLLDGVALDDGDDVLGEVAADVAEPLGELRGGSPESRLPLVAGAALVAGPLPLGAVDLAEGLVEVGLVAVEEGRAPGHLAQPLLGLTAEDEAPAGVTIGRHGCVLVSSVIMTIASQRRQGGQERGRTRLHRPRRASIMIRTSLSRTKAGENPGIRFPLRGSCYPG